MSDNFKAGIRFTPDIYAEIGYDSQNETGEMSVIGANGETIWESGEGGGGSSDFITVKMRATGAAGTIMHTFPVVIEQSGILCLTATTLSLTTNNEVDIVIPKNGGALGTLEPRGGADFEISGGIQHITSNQFMITGDCTITLAESPT